jgi:nitrogen regulatory protein PII
MKMVTAVIKPFKLDDVREALSTIGVEGSHRALSGRGIRGRFPAEN